MRSRQQSFGITLIEVVASLALLSTLLVALLRTKAGATQRAADARETLAAVEVADQMLANWWGVSSRVPVPAEGEVAGLEWRTRFVANVGAQALRARVVRLELFAKVRPDEPVVSVEILQKLANAK